MVMSSEHVFFFCWIWMYFYGHGLHSGMGRLALVRTSSGDIIFTVKEDF